MQAATTSTVQSIVEEFRDGPIGAREVIEMVLADHPEYGAGKASASAIPWPRLPGAVAAAEEYLSWIREIFVEDAFDGLLHGRAAVVGAALVDRAVGRQMVAIGLFQAIAVEFQEDLGSVLSADGLGRLRSIPLALIHRDSPGSSMFVGDRPIAVQSGYGEWVAVGQGANLTVYRGPAPVVESVMAEPISGLAIRASGRTVLVGLESTWGVFTVDDGSFATAGHGPAETGTQFSAARPGEPGPGFYAVPADGSALFATSAVSEVRMLDHDGAVRGLEMAEGSSAQVAVSSSARYIARPIPGAGVCVYEVGTRESGVRPETPGPDDVLVVSDAGQLAHTDTTSFPGSTVEDDGIHIGAFGDFPARGTSGFVAGSPLAFSPDGRFLAGATSDGIVLIEPVELGRVTTIETVEPGISSIGFSGDGHWLMATTEKGFVGQWEVGLTPAQQPPAPLDYIADSADGRGDDLLDIDPAVGAFASLIANRDLEPPLGVGVFGAWGSGKTFFMRRLRARVEELSTVARESGLMQREVSFAKRVVQVEFNAWHYSGGNLWAALVEHIFENLSLFGGEPESEVVARQRYILEEMNELDKRRDDLVREHRETEDAEGEITTRLNALETEHADKVCELRNNALTGFDAAPDGSSIHGKIVDLSKQLKLGDVGDTPADAAAALQEGRALLEHASPFLAVDRADGFWHTRFAMFVAALAGPLGAAILEGANTLAGSRFDSSVTAVIGAVTGLVASGTQWVTEQNSWIEERVAEGELLAARLTQQLQRAELDFANRRAALEKELDAIAGRMASAQLEAARAETERAALEARLEDLNPATVLAEYIMERAASDDYRKHLGLHARIKDDFDRIAGIMDEDRRAVRNATTVEDEDASANRRIDRIVLYIDDLDRCPADKVVEVLGAVHLLLAFPLFVAVVGIDARWGSTALKEVFPDLLGESGGATASPEDYLEKIFQVPYWLPPLDAPGAARFVEGMVGETPRPEAPEGSVSAPVADTPAADLSDSGGGSRPTRASTPTRHPPPPRPELNPVSLQMGHDERLFLGDVSGLLGSSPRAIKRFVNLYRLAKALASDPIDFVTERTGYGAPYQAVMVLLALDTGSPEQAGEMFHALDTWRPDPGESDDLATASTAIAVRLTPPATSVAQNLRTWAAAEPRRGDLSMQLVRSWLPRIGRFSFRAVQHPAAARADRPGSVVQPGSAGVRPRY